MPMLVGALFSMPVATAAAIPSDVAIATPQGKTATLVLAQYQNREGEGRGYVNQSDHGNHGQEKHNHHHHSYSYAHNIAIQAEVLGLSDEQLGKIVRLHLKEDHKAHGLLKKNMKKSMKAFRKAVAQPAIDEATLRKLGQEYLDSFNEMINYHVEERKVILSILTPEQIEKLKEIKTEQKEHEHKH
jgi:Spy/CpxP family protein refolding chaperone